MDGETRGPASVTLRVAGPLRAPYPFSAAEKRPTSLGSRRGTCSLPRENRGRGGAAWARGREGPRLPGPQRCALLRTFRERRWGSPCLGWTF